MAQYCDGEVVFFAQHMNALQAHRQQGGRAVGIRDGEVILCTGESEKVLLKLSDIPLLNHDKNPQAIANILAAIGAAWALHLTPTLIRAGLKTFIAPPRAAKL
ncbi:MAG: cyanophycin synthetase, partial [Gallionella sp.]